MTLHYHGTPITPLSVLRELRGRHLCVSFSRPEQVRVAHEIAQSVMLDNGAFSAWRIGKPTDWLGYYAWCEQWLACSSTWAVIPDVIDGDEAAQERLIQEWPHRGRGVPVWHMHESIERLVRMADSWARICIGSSGAYATILSDSWCHRMDKAWNALTRFGRIPWVHMLRGMQLVEHRWPFASVDSTDIARNHNRPQNSARSMADRWDGVQCPVGWTRAREQLFLSGAELA